MLNDKHKLVDLLGKRWMDFVVSNQGRD
jgi:hypothetical protein